MVRTILLCISHLQDAMKNKKQLEQKLLCLCHKKVVRKPFFAAFICNKTNNTYSQKNKKDNHKKNIFLHYCCKTTSKNSRKHNVVATPKKPCNISHLLSQQNSCNFVTYAIFDSLQK